MGDVPKEYLEFVEDEDGEIDGEIEKRGYWYNPNAHWDWYEIGGRWRGYFKLKKGTKGTLGESRVFDNPPTDDADQARKSTIDFEAMKRTNRDHAEKVWKKYQEKVVNGEQIEPYFMYGIHKDDTKEQYVKRQSSVATFAVLKDGMWYEKGSMGWFGIATNEKDENDWNEEFDQLLADLSDDTLLTVVDCHI